MKDDNSGFVVEPRSILKNEWYTDPFTMHLLRHCRLRANFENNKWRGITVERGQFITSLKTLSTETGLSVKQVRTALEKLEKTGYVASKATNKNRIITVVFYNEEQNIGKQKGKQRAAKKASQRQTEGKQRATDNNNISNDILTNKTSVCAQSAHTQQEPPTAPRAPDGRAPAAVTYQQMRGYQIDNAIGSGETVSEFYNGFVKSDTRFPENWQSVYTQYVRADFDAQIEFIERLQSGAYREKWGTADAGA